MEFTLFNMLKGLQVFAFLVNCRWWISAPCLRKLSNM